MDWNRKIDVFSRRHDSTSRSSRQDFLFGSISIIIMPIVLELICSIILSIIFLIFSYIFGDESRPLTIFFGAAIFIAFLVFSWIALRSLYSLCSRRLHDIGKSRILLLIPLFLCISLVAYIFIPPIELYNAYTLKMATQVLIIILLISTVILFLYMGLKGGQPGPNQYGPNPYEVQQNNEAIHDIPKEQPKSLCPQCGGEVKDEAKFCTKCGYKLHVCPHCSRIVPDNYKFCSYCGKEVLLQEADQGKNTQNSDDSVASVQQPEKSDQGENTQSSEDSAAALPQPEMPEIDPQPIQDTDYTHGDSQNEFLNLGR